MPSISDTLHIASQAIENALTASSTKKITPTTQSSAIHNHKRASKKLTDITEETVIATTDDDENKDKHIDLRV